MIVINSGSFNPTQLHSGRDQSAPFHLETGTCSCASEHQHPVRGRSGIGIEVSKQQPDAGATPPRGPLGPSPHAVPQLMDRRRRHAQLG